MDRRHRGGSVKCFVSFLVIPKGNTTPVILTISTKNAFHCSISLDSCIFMIYFQSQYNITLLFYVHIVTALDTGNSFIVSCSLLILLCVWGGGS